MYVIRQLLTCTDDRLNVGDKMKNKKHVMKMFDTMINDINYIKLNTYKLPSK